MTRYEIGIEKTRKLSDIYDSLPAETKLSLYSDFKDENFYRCFGRWVENLSRLERIIFKIKKQRY